MSTLYQITSTLIRWALYLAATGGLVSATLYIGQEAAKETQHGLVSLTSLNHQLMGVVPRNIHHLRGQR